MQHEQISVTLPDGSIKQFPPGATVRDVAKSIGPRLAKDAVGGLLNGKTQVDVHTPLTENVTLKILTINNEASLDILRHSTSHVMASAVQNLFPGTQVTFGPSVENGFYYDFKRDQGFSPEDLEKIQAKMSEIIAKDLPFERQVIGRDEAKQLFSKMGETFKVEHIDDIPVGESITLYRHGDWVDLCRGPHIPSTGFIKAFKLTHVAGAYWKGDERNPMLARIYGTAFWDQKALDAHLEKIEAAKNRDHRKLGKELDLFSLHPVAPAMPFFHPKGAVVYNQVIEFIRGYYRKIGFEEVITPQIVDVELFKRSGHYDNYREDMFFVNRDEREFGIKPMNCPGHAYLYSCQKFSYRDLPLRYADFGRLHRYERSGVTAGLTRVRSFCQDDAHIFCREDQIAREVAGQIAMVKDLYSHFGFEAKVKLATRPAQSIGREPGLTNEQRAEWDVVWITAEKQLQDVLTQQDLPFDVFPGDGSFYGPKIDFHVRDALDRWHQLGTIQLDYSMPRRFNLGYITAEGSEARPVMIHRALLGSMERFIGILLEHTAGDFPLWLAPVQVRILPVVDAVHDYAEIVAKALRSGDIRVAVDRRNEKLGFKIREAELAKIPVLMVIGKKEQADQTVSVRFRKKGDMGAMALDQAISHVLQAAAVPKPGASLVTQMEVVERL